MAIVALSMTMISISIFFTSFYKKIEVTEILLRVGFGWLEPSEISWHEGSLSKAFIIASFLVFSISFDMFYKTDFRTSLIARNFPPELEDFTQASILDVGLYLDNQLVCKQY